jgi:hypothetical protein
MDCRSEWNGRCDLPHRLHVVIHIVQVDGTHECFIGRLRSSLALADQSGTAIIHVLAEMHAELPLPTQILLHGVSTLRRGRKCDFCRQTGVSGYKAIFETSVVDDDVKIAIQEQAPAVQLRRILGAKGEAGLFERAVREAASGVISLEQACKFLDSLFRVPYSAFRNPHFLITPHSWRLCGLA